MDFGGNRRGKIDRFFCFFFFIVEGEGEGGGFEIGEIEIFLKVFPIPYSRPEVVNIHLK